MIAVLLLYSRLRLFPSRRLSSKFRVDHEYLSDSAEIQAIADFISTRNHLVVLTGAGVVIFLLSELF